MKERKKISGKNWEELASIFSGEKKDETGILTGSETAQAEKEWKEIGEMRNNKEIDVDRAWNNVYSRMTAGEPALPMKHSRLISSTFLRIAAALLIITGIGFLIKVSNNTAYLTRKITFTADADQINLKFGLPDGSSVYLNRNSELSYPKNFGKKIRAVTLKGEAFFEVSPDKQKPFVIDAGKASVTVVGTSFSVKTDNDVSEVEVYVKTGKVLLSKNEDQSSLMLDPGYIGKTSSASISRSMNNDPNYLAWNTGNLVYNGEKLKVVFRDLKKFYNMEVIADDPSIPELPWTAPIYYESQDKVILLICRSFNLSYSKVGNVYHLSVK